MDPDFESDKCVCQRPLVSVMCRNCGYRLSNCRKRIKCSEHPNVSYIQDLTECPQCHNSNDYLHEYDSSKSFHARLHTKQQTKTRSY
ncbi:hypothetical protein DAPPUDRAFT_315898 [Daphnia pulex]|uniref:Uncharacterized protein n=1 Tax=Daphnia pulex TaxID=6669 RepID=E9GB71_DAPPU|nr:hypothetical protein DAPPUDRAFT_315898 [Daphnia pulex]|eukprot:EFX83414.1 hypothetical protein DAPPUDRAFT_315898 [Daphnia pulex]